MTNLFFSFDKNSKIISDLNGKKINFDFLRKLKLKSLYFQILKNLKTIELNTLFWTHITSLSILLKFLRLNLKQRSVSVQKGLKKIKREKIFSFEKTEEEDKHSLSLKNSSDAFFREKKFWLNEVEDWNKPTQQKSLQTNQITIQNKLDQKDEASIFVSEWFSINRTRFSGIQNRIPLKIKKKKEPVLKEKKYSKEEKLSLKKSFFKIKINKLNLFAFKRNLFNDIPVSLGKSSFTQNILGTLASNLNKDTGSSDLKGEKNSSEKFFPSFVSFPPIDYPHTTKKFQIGRGMKNNKSPKTPKIVENVKNKNFKINFLNQNQIDKKIFSKMTLLKSEKIILKQFNPWGDINFFFRSGQKT